MSFDVTREQEARKTMTRRFGNSKTGQTLTFTYLPHAYSFEEQAAFETEYAKCTTSTEQAIALADYLQNILVEADWVDKEGPIPVEAELMRKRIPFDVLMWVFKQISEDKSGGKA